MALDELPPRKTGFEFAALSEFAKDPPYRADGDIDPEYTNTLLSGLYAY